MTVKCDKCKENLIITSFGYLHPIKGDCSEDDGVRVEEQVRYVFEKKYGTPKSLPEKKVKAQQKTILELTEDLESLTEISVGIMSENAELIAQLEEEEEKWLKTNKKLAQLEKQMSLPVWKQVLQKKNFSKA